LCPQLAEMLKYYWHVNKVIIIIIIIT
jgi:hypothetical protein